MYGACNDGSQDREGTFCSGGCTGSLIGLNQEVGVPRTAVRNKVHSALMFSHVRCARSDGSDLLCDKQGPLLNLEARGVPVITEIMKRHTCCTFLQMEAATALHRRKQAAEEKAGVKYLY